MRLHPIELIEEVDRPADNCGITYRSVGVGIASAHTRNDDHLGAFDGTVARRCEWRFIASHLFEVAARWVEAWPDKWRPAHLLWWCAYKLDSDG